MIIMTKAMVESQIWRTGSLGASPIRDRVEEIEVWKKLNSEYDEITFAPAVSMFSTQSSKVSIIEEQLVAI